MEPIEDRADAGPGEPGPRLTPTPAPPPAPAPAAGGGSRYTAVVYFHGMGEQRRHEELSRLLDALDVHANQVSRQSATPRGRLQNIKPQIEPSRLQTGLPVLQPGTPALPSKDEDDVEFVRADCDPPGRRHGAGTLYRFYEVYWAPITAGGSSVASVVAWLVAQLRTPLRTMRSPWRERQRLRRSAACRLWRSAGLDEKDLAKLAETYDDFEGPEARRQYPAGRFSEFRAFLAAAYAKRPETARRLDALTRRWGLAYLAGELRNLFILVTLVVTIVLLGTLSVYGIYKAYGWVWGAWSASRFAASPAAGFAEHLKPNLTNLLAVLGIVASAVGLTRFVKTYLGDVQLWCTYEETDEKHKKRTEVLATATSRLIHVLEDERCARAIVVAHSLGTAIAMDALLRLGRFNRARNAENPIAGPLPLAKLCCFVTMGSPIDKIHYFFESYRSSYHRYVRVVESLRGDISTVPFAKNRKPHVHWINFWDRGDVISGLLDTPSGVRTAGLQVDNVHVSSFHFPVPGASHSAYFEHRDVIAKLYDVVFRGAYDFALAVKKDPADKSSPLDYGPLLLGPGRRSLTARYYQAVVLALPWALIAGLVTWRFGDGVLGGRILWACAGVVLALAAACTLSTAAGHSAPIRPRAGAKPAAFPIPPDPAPPGPPAIAPESPSALLDSASRPQAHNPAKGPS